MANDLVQGVQLRRNVGDDLATFSAIESLRLRAVTGVRYQPRQW